MSTLNRIIKRTLQNEYRRQTQKRTGTVRPARAATSASASLVSVAGQHFPAVGVTAPTGSGVAVKNAGRPANAVYMPEQASGVVYVAGAAGLPSGGDGDGGDTSTYIAGNGISIVGTTISTKNKTNAGIGSDGSGNYLVVPATSGLTVDATGVYIGAGDGISVLAHSLALNVDTDPGLEFISGKVRVKVDSTMVRGASGVGVNTAHAFGWTAEHTFNAETNFSDDLQVGANIDFVGGNRSITGSNSVTIAPATDLILDPGGVVSYPNSQESRTSTFTDSVTGILGFRLFDNSSGGNTMQLTANAGKFDNLFARKFQADEQRVARGSWFLTYSYGIVETSFTVPAVGSTVDVWFEEAPGLGSFKLFSADHWILFRFIDIPSGTIAATIWFQAVDADGAGTNDYITRQDQVAGTGGHLARQQWRLKRMSGGATGITVNKGETAADFALPPHTEGSTPIPGQGIVYATSLYEDSGPYIQIQTFESVISNVPQFKNRVRMGNLSGTVDYMSDAWGFAAGDDLSVLPSAGFSGVAIDAATGTRLFNTDIVLYNSTIPTVKLVRDDGLMFRFDDVGSDNDPLRMIAWFDDIDAPSRTIGDGWSYILSTHYDQGGGNYVRLMKGELLVPEGVDEEGRVSWQASNYDESKFASLFLSTKNTLSDGGTGSASALSSDEVRLSSYVVVGAAPGFTNFADSARLHVYDSNAVINKRAGLVIQQQGSGDAVLHWYLSGTSDTHKWWSAGIDHTTVPLWKLSASDSLGTSDFIVINPATGTVTINGLDGGSAASGLTGGDGITISGSSIAVNSSVARTTTHIIAGNGLSGGGTIDADRTLSVLLPTISGLTATGSGLAVGAGDGVTVNAHDVAVDGTVVRTTRAISAGDGLSGGGTLAADRSFAVDATVVRTSRTIISGGGLTGGGDLSANRTVAVGAGDGIAVNADDVAVDATVVRTSRVLTAGNGLTGGGSLAADRTFDVGAGNGISVAADSVAVDQSYGFAWTGAQSWAAASTFNGSFTLNNNLAITGARTITTDSTNGLIITPGGSLTLSPASGVILPASSYVTDIGAYNRKFRTLYIAELYAETLVAQSVLATIGGRVVVAPTNTLVADLSSIATTINVKYNNFVNGSYIVLENAPGGIPQFESMKVTSAASGSAGNYTYTVARNQDGSGANAWVIGDAAIDTGSVAGQGYIDLAATSTLFGHIGPTITVYARRATTAWNSITPTTTMGNLKNFVDYASDEYGFGVGNDLTLTPATGFSGLTADRTAGLRLFNTPIKLYSGSTLSLSIEKLTGIELMRQGTSDDLGLIAWYDDLTNKTYSPNNYLASIYTARDPSGIDVAVNRLELIAHGSNATSNEARVVINAGNFSGSESLTMSLNTTSWQVVDDQLPGLFMKMIRPGWLLIGDNGGNPTSVIHAYENTTATGAGAGLTIEQAGSGDAVLRFLFSGGASWWVGGDNSDGDKFKVSKNGALGSGDVLTIDTSGVVTIAPTAAYSHSVISGLFIKNGTAGAGAGNYGGSIILGNPNGASGPLTGAAIAAIQNGSDPDNVGLVFTVHGNTSTDPRVTFLSLTANGALFSTGVTATSLDLSGYATVGGLLTASGGINLGGTTLANYAEGTWTPALKFGGASVGMTYAASSQQGIYTRIGNQIHAWGTFTLTAKGSSTGAVTITGLPVAAASLPANSMGICSWAFMATSYIQIKCAVSPGTTTLALLANTAAATNDQFGLTEAAFNNNSVIQFDIWYRV